VRDVRFMPGEHDASLDRGEAYREHFGAPNYVFDHKGVHFIAIDNVSDHRARSGPSSSPGCARDLAQRDAGAPIVVLTHRPLFDLYPDWDWATADGAEALALLMPHRNVVVFYGHIHQEHHHMTQHIAHHAAQSLIFPQPAPGRSRAARRCRGTRRTRSRASAFRGIQAASGGYTLNERGIA
jgi:3',5'-cyclic AMP phosphodiesterase CpdA